MNKVIIISAPSGAGKTTMAQYLLSQDNLNLTFSISATTRKPRPTESEGIDYYFFDKNKFKEYIKQNKFIEWEEVYENLFYGTLKEEVERIFEKNKNILFDVDVKGGKKLKNYFKDRALSIFIAPPSINELEKRLRNRHTDSDTIINKRLAKATKELDEKIYFDNIIVNDNIDRTKMEIYQIVKSFLDK